MHGVCQSQDDDEDSHFRISCPLGIATIPALQERIKRSRLQPLHIRGSSSRTSFLCGPMESGIRKPAQP